MTPLDAIRTRKSEIRTIAAKHGAGNIRVFGSVAEEHPKKVTWIS